MVTKTTTTGPNFAPGGHVAIFLSGDKAIHIRFNTAVECFLYTSLLDKIRAENNCIVEDGGVEGIPPKIFKRRVKKWLKLCAKFRAMCHNDGMVLPDVRFAWNDGEKHVGLPVTIFNV